ncbi:MAG: NUDIX domain-containing protein [Syntrophothermus sp.]
MRTRAGIVLIQDQKVALIERFRAGLHYFVFPGGGMDEGETPEQAAVREAKEELGIEVGIRQKVAEIQLASKSRQIYYLVEQTGGEFGTGTGEEYQDADPNDPDEGVYIPVWMPIEELTLHEKIFPREVVDLVLRSVMEGWSDVPTITFEERR